jgi:hypothetical protein
MSWEEVHTRVGQEVAKRLDLARYRVGLGAGTNHLPSQDLAHATFFFGKDGDDAAQRAALLREHLPHEADAIIHEAEDICRHALPLLGYDKVDFGPNIDWHSDPVHGKRSLLKPWFKIDFLNFQEVGDHKIIWELNRHQHLVTLAKAWRLTGNQVYTSELASQWYSWQKANPYPLGINWCSALEVAFRSLSWLWIRDLVAGCPDLPATFETDLLLALQTNGRYIERYLSTYYSPNTHLLGEAVALFFIGTSCPEIAAAQRWRNAGWKIVLEESKRQVRPDGVYFEQALYYHVYALDFFLHARHLAGKNGFTIPEQFDDTLKRMLDVVLALSQAGSPEGFGDDDGGRVFNPRRNHVGHMTDPLALGSVLYGDQYAIGGLTEEAVWLFGDRAVAAFANPRPASATASKAFESGGIYLANDHAPCTQQMMIDAGPQGTSRSGHGHADALSIRLSLDGHRMLVDPGTYCYVSEGKERDRFRGTGAHNTLRVDGLDQAVPEGPFAWSSIPRVQAETWVNGQTFDFFAGSHDGYQRLPDPVLHRREIFHVKGGLWLVRDVAEGKGEHLLETFWHFAPEVEVTERPGVISALPRATENHTKRNGLTMLADRNSSWTMEITEGFVSPAYGSMQVAPAVRIKAETRLPQDCALALLPATEATEIGALTALGESPVRGARGYRYQTAHSNEFIFVSQGSTPWTCGPWNSDARLLYCKLKGSRLAHVIMVSGTFAEWRGKRFVSRSSPDTVFEWLNQPGSTNAFSHAGEQVEQGVVSTFEFVNGVL